MVGIYSYLKGAFTFAMVILFLWQSWVSVEKYRLKDSIRIRQILSETEVPFPSISLCGYKNNDFVKNSYIFEASKVRMPDFLLCYARYNDGFTKYLRKCIHGNDDWSLTMSLDNLIQNKHTACYTYKTTKEYPLGYNSMMSLFINITEGLDNLMLYVHPRDQAVLQPNSIHGKDYVAFSTRAEEDNPQNDTEFRQISLEVTPTLHEVLPKSKLPCHKSKVDHDIGECMDRHVEREDGCVLPWRASEGSNIEVCKNLSRFNELHGLYYSASEKNIFEETGCYSGCTFFSYSFELIEDKISSHSPRNQCGDYRYDNETDASTSCQMQYEMSKDNIAKYRTFNNCPDEKWAKVNSGNDLAMCPNCPGCKSSYDILLHLYLAPGGLPSEREIWTFDFLDLVGNVGGYLGLFLGASVLSLFDWVRMIGDRPWGAIEPKLKQLKKHRPFSKKHKQSSIKSIEAINVQESK